MIRLHILHHSAEAPIFGLAIIEELRHNGYELSAGTMYPMLHCLEKKGYLRSHHERTGRHKRRMYEITDEGRAALADAKSKVRELFGELTEGHCRSDPECLHLAPLSNEHVPTENSGLLTTSASGRNLQKADGITGA